MSDYTQAIADALFEWNTPGAPYFVIKGRDGEAPVDEDCYLPIARVALAAVAHMVDGDVSLFAEIEHLASGANPSTAADKIQDAVVAYIARADR